MHMHMHVQHVTYACAGAAQYMFSWATAFNQPLASWDVAQVTNMGVRRRPCLGWVLLRTQLPSEGCGTSRACVLTWRRVC